MKAAAVAVTTMEETMKYWTIDALMQLTRGELLELFRSISSQLPTLPCGSNEHREALEVLANIRAALARPVFAPRRIGWKPPSP